MKSLNLNILDGSFVLMNVHLFVGGNRVESGVDSGAKNAPKKN